MQKIVAELSEALGWADAILIVRKWGGRELNVPKKVGHGDPLALALGMDSARRLVDTFAGVRLELPSERNALLDMRNAAITSERRAGATFEEIAIRYGMTRQAVSYIVKKMGDTVNVCGVEKTEPATQSRAIP